MIFLPLILFGIRPNDQVFSVFISKLEQQGSLQLAFLVNTRRFEHLEKHQVNIEELELTYRNQ